jgi:hypothetical protein
VKQPSCGSCCVARHPVVTCATGPCARAWSQSVRASRWCVARPACVDAVCQQLLWTPGGRQPSGERASLIACMTLVCSCCHPLVCAYATFQSATLSSRGVEHHTCSVHPVTRRAWLLCGQYLSYVWPHNLLWTVPAAGTAPHSVNGLLAPHTGCCAQLCHLKTNEEGSRRCEQLEMS